MLKRVLLILAAAAPVLSQPAAAYEYPTHGRFTPPRPYGHSGGYGYGHSYGSYGSGRSYGYQHSYGYGHGYGYQHSYGYGHGYGYQHSYGYGQGYGYGYRPRTYAAPAYETPYYTTVSYWRPRVIDAYAVVPVTTYASVPVKIYTTPQTPPYYNVPPYPVSAAPCTCE